MRRLIASLAGVVLAFGIGNVRGDTLLVDSATEAWQDSGVDVIAGQTLLITASGNVFHQADWSIPRGYSNPDGVGLYGDGTNWFGDGPQVDPLTIFPSTIALSLIGKIGGTTNFGTGTPVPEGVLGKGAGFVGSSYSEQIPTSGRLFFAYNDELGEFWDNSGSFSVTVTVVPEPSSFVLLCVAAAGLAFYARWRRAVK